MGEFAALLKIVRLPARLPALAGAKFTETLTESFGARVIFDPPLALKPDPEADAEEIVTFEFPTFVKLTSCAVEAPTVTLPKLRLETLADN